MRVVLMAFMLTLGLAAPARATPITLQFSGVINTVSPSVSSSLLVCPLGIPS